MIQQMFLLFNRIWKHYQMRFQISYYSVTLVLFKYKLCGSLNEIGCSQELFYLQFFVSLNGSHDSSITQISKIKQLNLLNLMTQKFYFFRYIWGSPISLQSQPTRSLKPSEKSFGLYSHNILSLDLVLIYSIFIYQFYFVNV